MIRLTHVAVEHWRGLSTEVSFERDVTLVEGPNEAGKSRLIEAIVFGLTESAKGSSSYKKSLRSWENPAAVPTVRLTFEAEGTTWRLTKRFSGGHTPGHTELVREADGRQWVDAEAERRLRELLGLQEASSGRPKRPLIGSGHEGLGPLPLCVVLQRSGHISPYASPTDGGLPDDGMHWLTQLLAQQVGQVALGPRGTRLLQRIEKAWEAVRPDSRGARKARKGTPMGEAGQHLDAARAAYREALERWRKARDLDVEIAACRKGIGELERNLTAEDEKLATQQDDIERLERVERELQHAHKAAEDAEAEVKRRRERLDERQRLAERLAEASERLDAARATFERAERVAADLCAAHEQARRQADALDEEVRRARAAHEQHRDALERFRASRDLAQKQSRLERAEAAYEALREAQRRHERLKRYDKKASERLQQAREQLRDAEARLAAVAVRVELEAARDLQVDETPVAKGKRRDWLLSERGRIELRDEHGALATVWVEPRSADLRTLREQVEEARIAIARIAEKLGLPSAPEEALRRFQEKASERIEADAAVQREAAALRELLDVPKGRSRSRGVKAIEEALETLRAEVERLLAELGDQAAAPGDEQDEAALQKAVRDARERLDAVERQHQALVAEARRREDEWAAHGEQREAARAALDEARIEVERLRGALQGLGTEEALRAALEEAERDEAARRKHLGELQAQFDQLGGSRLREEQRRLQRERERLKERLGERLRELASLQATRSATVGEGDVRRTLAERGADLLDAAREMRRAVEETEALKLLLERLRRQASEAVERLHEPVLELVAQAVPRVFGPGASLKVQQESAADARPQPFLLRDGRRIEHEQLSAGAQEQLALMLRVAAVRLWARSQGEGASVPLLLEDPLTETDARRFPELARFLVEAAEDGVQVVLLTCHPEPYKAAAPRFVVGQRHLRAGQ